VFSFFCAPSCLLSVLIYLIVLFQIITMIFFLYLSHLNSAVLQNWSVAGNKAFLESSNKLGSEFSAVLKSPVSSPFQFLFNLLKLFHDAHDNLNSQSSYYQQQHHSTATLQDAILFLGERDANGNEEATKPGILQILDSEWNFHSITQSATPTERTEPGLLADLETTCRLVDQRLKVCRSRVLTLTGKEKRAQQLKEDPRYADWPTNSV
jgi:hypothetical protein